MCEEDKNEFEVTYLKVPGLKLNPTQNINRFLYD